MTKVKDGFSYPPRGLSREEAARYIGVGTTKFDEMVGALVLVLALTMGHIENGQPRKASDELTLAKG